MATKFCPHCGEKNGFQVNFNIVCRIGDKEEKDIYGPAKIAVGGLLPSKKMNG
ncbi:MAG: hypothetical protein QNK14_06065 [Desulfobacterales bacterium]|nr:hypothetical protein [Desulfobacterales bacterium]